MVVVAPVSAPVLCPMQRTSAFRAANAARSSSSIGACKAAQSSTPHSHNMPPPGEGPLVVLQSSRQKLWMCGHSFT